MFNNIADWYEHLDWIYLTSLFKQLPGIFFNHFIQLAPYVVLGSILSELLKLTSWTKILYKWISGHEIVSIIMAALLGIISPLCTYGTVPVLITLFNAGISIPPLISFLAASSMLNPQLFIMICGGLSVEIALIQLLCVFIFGILIGFITMLIPQNFIIRKKLLDSALLDAKPKKEISVKIYFKNLYGNLLFVGKMFLLGIFIASFVDLLPLNLYIEKINTTTPLGIVIAAVAGVPMYACGGGVIPALSSLMAQGLSKGSAIAFLIAGPATRITSLAAIATILKKKFIAFYVIILLMFSIAAGIFLL